MLENRRACTRASSRIWSRRSCPLDNRGISRRVPRSRSRSWSKWRSRCRGSVHRCWTSNPVPNCCWIFRAPPPRLFDRSSTTRPCFDTWAQTLSVQSSSNFKLARRDPLACDIRVSRRMWRPRRDRIEIRRRSARPAIDSSSSGWTRTPLARRTKGCRPGTGRRENPCRGPRRTAQPSTRPGTSAIDARNWFSTRIDLLSIETPPIFHPRRPREKLTLSSVSFQRSSREHIYIYIYRSLIYKRKYNVFLSLSYTAFQHCQQ